jgi:hypothetical protein
MSKTSVALSIDVTGLSSSGAVRSFTAISGDCERGLRAEISTGYRDSSTETTGLKPSIEGTIDGDLHLDSSNCALDDLYLRFCLFGWSIPV